MATLAVSPPSSPSWPKRRPRAWALRCERLTTWAVYVEASIGFQPSETCWVGLPSSILGVVLYLCLNISYTTAVFTDPGSPLGGRGNRNGQHQYSALPITELPEYTSYTVNSTGGSRFCKKCQSPKPDRAHHCSTCKRCVLKMDHHCPWLATCVGLYNYKAFLLFLIYTSLFCWVDFAVAAIWIWTEVLNETRYIDGILPVNVVLLSILGGIIGLVLTGFTAWHISLAVRGITTIESLEKTRYVSPLRKALDRHRYEHLLGSDQEGPGGGGQDSFSRRLQNYGGQILEAHANAIPGVTRPEEGEERTSPAPWPTPTAQSTPSPGMEQFTPAQQALSRSYAELERQREHDRYQDYLAEVDNEKMPSAFDLGWRQNLLHLFGDRPWLWLVPICTTPADGWHWEPSSKFLEARERVRQRREQAQAEQMQQDRDLYQRNMNNARSWLGSELPQGWTPDQPLGGLHDPERPATGVSMKTLAPRSPRPRPGDSDYGEDFEEGQNLSLGSGPENKAATNGNEDDWRTQRERNNPLISPPLLPDNPNIQETTQHRKKGRKKKMSRSVRRLMKEASELSNSPSPHFHAQPVSESNLYDWHFTLAGPPAPSPYAGGIYHGRIVLPSTYPLRPPSFRFLTPSGRFEVNREICLSISGHHEETWQPAWGIRTALLAIRSFMDGDVKGQVGGLEVSDEIRIEHARMSREWRCDVCEGGGKSNEQVLSEWREVCRGKGVDIEKEDETERVPEGLLGLLLPRSNSSTLASSPPSESESVSAAPADLTGEGDKRGEQSSSIAPADADGDGDGDRDGDRAPLRPCYPVRYNRQFRVPHNHGYK
ncbi:hypothetical protein AOCH_004891, partial [Aspergillus ochraceoroseus]